MLKKAERLTRRATGVGVVLCRAGSDRGVEAVEFALILPVLLTLLFGIIAMGTVFYHYEMLISATEAGCRYFAAARGTTNPYTLAKSAVTSYASGLVSSSINVTFLVNGLPCTDASSPNCATMLAGAQGTPVTVMTSYPCTIVVMGVNFAPGGCTLTQTLTESVE